MKMGEDKRMEEKETGRTEAFSDGVFAVAITLLVLNIKIPAPDLADDKLKQALVSELPTLAAYVTSFATIGVMWTTPRHRSPNR
jgi:uncharacterized membrane protein